MTKRDLEEYHYVWLAGSRGRTEEWLRERLSDGFDVHHLDGNHKNNAFENLVLIEHHDHMRLHGKSTLSRIGHSSPGVSALVMARGKKAYHLRMSGLTWGDVGEAIGMTRSIAVSSAKTYAKASESAWPITSAELRPISQRGAVRCFVI